MNKFKEIVVVTALVAISAVPRFVGLGDFTSIDEPFWLRQSGNFYYALGQREFQNTLYEYHPAVTTMWIITGGMLAYFPEYRALGQGYLKPGKFDEFMLQHGKSLLELLTVSRGIQVLLILVLLVAMYALLRALFDRRSAFFATAFVSLAPFLMGQSRLLNHEAMVGLFSMVSLLGILAYAYRGQRFGALLISGVAAGLAQLTKSSAMPIILLVPLVLVTHALTAKGQARGTLLARALGVLGLWLAILAGTYILVWPGMWVAPLAMLQDVYGNAFSYALQGVRTSVAPGLDAHGIDAASIVGGIGIYINDLIWRTTPVTVLGVLAAIALGMRRARNDDDGIFRWLALYAFLLAAAFVLLFGIQRGPKPPHYILTSYVALDVVAGLALVRAWTWLARRFPAIDTRTGTALALGIILVIQLSSALRAFPYYISYYNPVVEALQPGVQNPTLNDNGYGVGLDQAAAYLAAKPRAQNLVVLSAHGLGSFSYYFPGRTVAMNNFSMSDPEVAAIVPDTDYIVVDYYNHERKHVDQDLTRVQPEKSIWINGIEFLRIYPSSEFLSAAP
ncbi:MAG TPA: glycosyltransferase family 39 protein [Anaerolineales bacterium]|nr:glycosyltransferase family 39 protein [Anaerolineales bacterium]